MPKKNLLRSTWPRVRKILHHGHERFLVDCRPVGKRELWDNAADAMAAAERIARQRANDGAASFAELSPSDRRDASEALSILPEGVTLLDAARDFVTSRLRSRALASVPTVTEALTTYLAAKRAEYDRGELAKVTLAELEAKGRIIERAFGEKNLADIDEAAAAKFIHGLRGSPQYRKNVRTKLSQFLNYCVRQKWLPSNPAAHVTVKLKAREVEILSIDQVRRLLLAAASAEPAPGVFPYVAVQLFGGLRPFEAAQLRWEYVHLETAQIEVRASTSKTRQTRYVHMELCLIEALLPYRRSHGLIVGPRFRAALREVKKEAGLSEWVQDVLRHCYGSYWLAVHKDRAHLAEAMGNSVQVIRQHYRRAIPEVAAREYWTLPGVKIVEFKQPEVA
jgi:integrase